MECEEQRKMWADKEMGIALGGRWWDNQTKTERLINSPRSMFIADFMAVPMKLPVSETGMEQERE